jgi:hypothetical protein
LSSQLISSITKGSSRIKDEELVSKYSKKLSGSELSPKLSGKAKTVLKFNNKPIKISLNSKSFFKFSIKPLNK